MDDEVDRRPTLRQSREGLVELGHVRDVALDQEVAAELLGERAHALLHRLALIAEREFGALLAQLLGNPPGQRTIVGEAHDQPALTLHQSGHVRSVLLIARPLYSVRRRFG